MTNPYGGARAQLFGMPALPTQYLEHLDGVHSMLPLRLCDHGQDARLPCVPLGFLVCPQDATTSKPLAPSPD